MRKFFFALCASICISNFTLCMEDIIKLISEDIKNITQDGPIPAELFLKALTHAKALQKEPCDKVREVKILLAQTITAEEPKKELYETTEKDNYTHEQLLTFKHLTLMRRSIAQKRILFAKNTLMLMECLTTEQTIKQSTHTQQGYITAQPKTIKQP